MKTWKFSLYLGLCSCITLLVAFFLPGEYSIFIWSNEGVGAGRLFPIMFFIWIAAIIAFAINNVFADKCYIDHNLKMRSAQKYLPSLLGLPALLSFVWFLYTWIKQTPFL